LFCATVIHGLTSPLRTTKQSHGYVDVRTQRFASQVALARILTRALLVIHSLDAVATQVGQCCGVKYALLQRNLFRPGMVLKVNEGNRQLKRECSCAKESTEIKDCCKTLDMVFVLNEQPDFQQQRPCIEEVVLARGHLVIWSPKVRT
jgi:hypothetical protein